MSSNVVDLDVFVGENKKVHLGGTEYTLPADLPFEIYLRMNLAAELEEESEAKALEAMLEVVTDLFTTLYADADKPKVKEAVGKILRARGIKFNLDIIKAIYREEDEVPTPETPEPDGPPTLTVVGTPSTSS